MGLLAYEHKLESLSLLLSLSLRLHHKKAKNSSAPDKKDVVVPLETPSSPHPLPRCQHAPHPPLASTHYGCITAISNSHL